MENSKNFEIFNSISELVQDPKFGDNQYTFFEKNADQFEDDVEENKLEHTNIHQEYVHILESIMEASLKQTYSDEEINNFYVDFATDMKKYEAINSHTMDQLYGFIDFPVFKENIIAYKKGPMAQKAEDQKAQDEAYAKTLAAMTGDSLGKFHELNKEDPKDPNSKWTKTISIPEKDGFELFVYKRPMEGSTLDITRSDVLMRNVSLSSMRKFAKDYEKYSARVDKKNMVRWFKWVVNNDPEGYSVFHSRSKVGAMASDREIVAEMRVQEVDGGNSLFFLCQSVDRDDIPEHDGAVRMMYYKSNMDTQEGADVRIVQFESMDLRGYFPASMMNMIISQYTADSLRGFYEVLQEIEKE